VEAACSSIAERKRRAQGYAHDILRWCGYHCVYCDPGMRTFNGWLQLSWTTLYRSRSSGWASRASGSECGQPRRLLPSLDRRTDHERHASEGAVTAVVVYESLWGNTAAIARAIAEGLGEGVRALSTAEDRGAALAEAELIVAGAPVLGFRLPTEAMRQSVVTSERNAPTPPDLSHPSMRSWLDALPHRRGRSAAFETRIWWSPGGATGPIADKLGQAGYPRSRRRAVSSSRASTARSATVNSSEPGAGAPSWPTQWNRRGRQHERVAVRQSVPASDRDRPEPTGCQKAPAFWGRGPLPGTPYRRECEQSSRHAARRPSVASGAHRCQQAPCRR